LHQIDLSGSLFPEIFKIPGVHFFYSFDGLLEAVRIFIYFTIQAD
jgi:hypothetical protein